MWDIRRSNLIDRGQLDQVIGEFLKRNPRAEPAQLAEYLVSQEILTAFQSTRILEGKTQGLVLGPYVLIDAIGAGSMGQVYKAINKTDNQLYAIKVLPRRNMWNVRLARRQVRAFSQFTHPAVVPFVDVGTSGGLHYLVWPLVSGETLEAMVQRLGRLTPDQTAQIGSQIAQGLAVCHQNGLFHGLLKPSNIMIGTDGQSRILDFGIGSLLAENEGESLVDTMSASNTLTSGLDCASPESIMEPTNRTPAGDQYSLGCTLYYCVTGRFPFPEGSAVEKMMSHQSRTPDPVAELAPGLPAAMVTIIERLMQKSPEHRYSGADEIVDSLQPLVGAAAATAGRRSGTIQRPQPGSAVMSPPPRPNPPAAPATPTGSSYPTRPASNTPTSYPPPIAPTRPAAPTPLPGTYPPQAPAYAPPQAQPPFAQQPPAYAPQQPPGYAPPMPPGYPQQPPGYPQQPPFANNPAAPPFAAPPGYAQQPAPGFPTAPPPQGNPEVPGWAGPGGWVDEEKQSRVNFGGVGFAILAVILVGAAFVVGLMVFKPAQ
ncbi:serine/threonine protein kinase [Tuwongella immobilis]|uniref:serine/threonine protein kinase n=1 Tax=Tuwongella immobilis TaxID=692036 RepID=UPI001E5EE1C2|nr:serine/threonine-protein kinase [Tuwongella immobilis]